MKKILTFLVLLTSCKGGVHQEIVLINNSSKNIHYILHGDSIPIKYKINAIRAKNDNEIAEHFKNLRNYSLFDSLEISLGMKIPYLLYPSTFKSIFTSKGIKIFNDKESIQQQINEQYNGRLQILIIDDKDLKVYSNEEIIEKKLYKQFVTLTEKDIIKDTLIFEYKN